MTKTQSKHFAHSPCYERGVCKWSFRSPPPARSPQTHRTAQPRDCRLSIRGRRVLARVCSWALTGAGLPSPLTSSYCTCRTCPALPNVSPALSCHKLGNNDIVYCQRCRRNSEDSLLQRFLCLELHHANWAFLPFRGGDQPRRSPPGAECLSKETWLRTGHFRGLPGGEARPAPDLCVCLSFSLEVRPRLPLDLSVCLSFFLEVRPHLPLDLSVCPPWRWGSSGP